MSHHVYKTRRLYRDNGTFIPTKLFLPRLLIIIESFQQRKGKQKTKKVFNGLKSEWKKEIIFFLIRYKIE